MDLSRRPFALADKILAEGKCHVTANLSDWYRNLLKLIKAMSITYLKYIFKPVEQGLSRTI